VYELQRGLRVSGRIYVVNAASSDVHRREVQCVWRDVVQQLQRRLRVSVPWC
jgi:hypothetical protein